MTELLHVSRIVLGFSIIVSMGACSGNSSKNDVKHMVLVTGWGTTLQGSGAIDIRPAFLFNNKTACFCLDVDPNTFDLQTHKNSRPKDIAKWRGNGRNIEVFWKGKWRETEKMRQVDTEMLIGEPWKPYGKVKRSNSDLQELHFQKGNRVTISSNGNEVIGTYKLDGFSLSLAHPQMDQKIAYSIASSTLNENTEALRIAGRLYLREK